MKYKILAIDDEPDICWMIDQYLSENGFTVFTSFDGATALDILEKDKPNLVIVDKKMPNLDGIGFIKEMLRRGIKLPVIMMTGSVSIIDPDPSMCPACDIEYMSKPVSLKSLKEVILSKLDPDRR